MALTQVMAQAIGFGPGGIDDHFGLEFEGVCGRVRSHIAHHDATHPAIVLAQQTFHTGIIQGYAAIPYSFPLMEL